MLVTVTSPFKDVDKKTIPEKEPGEAKYEEIPLVKNVVIQRKRRSKVRMAGRLCMALTLVTLLLHIGFGLGFYMLREKFVLQRTVEEGQMCDIGSCSSFPHGKLQKGIFLMICVPKMENSANPNDKATHKVHRVRKSVGVVNSNYFISAYNDSKIALNPMNPKF